MGLITIEKANHLFWLGRYSERMTGLIRLFMIVYDQLIDVDAKAYIDFCERLSIDPNIYKDDEDFIERFVYDVSLPDSLVSTISRAYDNAIELREAITGDTFAYIDLAKHILTREEHGTLMLELQKVLDYINAFWGSANDTVDENSRSIMKCGKHAEKLDIQYRFGIESEEAERVKAKLKHRIASLNERYPQAGFAEITEKFADETAKPADYIEYIFELTDCFNII